MQTLIHFYRWLDSLNKWELTLLACAILFAWSCVFFVALKLVSRIQPADAREDEQ